MEVKEKHLLWVIPILVLGVKLSDFNGLYGQDAYEYYKCSCELFQKEASVCHFPILYAFYGKLFSVIFGQIFALQLVSIAASAGILFFTHRIILLFYPAHRNQSVIYVLLFGGMSAYFFRAAPLVMSDTLNTFFMIGGLYSLLLVRNTPPKQAKTFLYALLSVLFLLQCVFTRYASAVFVLYYFVCFPFVVFPRLSVKQNALLILSGLGCLALLIFLQADFIRQGSSHTHVLNWSVRHFWQNTFFSPDGNSVYRYPNFVFGLIQLIHPGFGLLSGIFVLLLNPKTLLSKSFPLLVFLGIPLCLYLVFLMGIPFQNIRFYVLSFPLCLVLFYSSFLRIYGFMEKYQFQIPLYCIVFLLQVGLCGLGIQKLLINNRLDQTIAHSLQSHIHTPALFTLGMEGAMRAYNIPIPVTSLYYKALTDYPDSSLLLLSTQTFETQWKGKMPGENLDYIKTHYRIDTLQHFDEGWKLFIINRK